MKKFLVLILSLFLIFLLVRYGKQPAKVVAEYNDKIGGEVMLSNPEAYGIGADKNGRPIFKDTDKALKQAKIDFADGLKLIKDQFNLMSVSKYYYEPYKTYGWQVNTDDPKLRKKCGEISLFFDIYENSFGKE
ncbi:hypothetical protein UT300007_10470 [Clostridium sp. CTA-7]